MARIRQDLVSDSEPWVVCNEYKWQREKIACCLAEIQNDGLENQGFCSALSIFPALIIVTASITQSKSIIISSLH